MSKTRRSENNDSAKTKRQLVNELKSVRRQNNQLRRSATKIDQTSGDGILESSRETLKRDLRQAFNILDSTADAVISIDENKKITHFNKGAEELFGYEAAERIGEPLETLLPPEFRSRHDKLVTSFFQSADDSRTMNKPTDIVGLRKDGTVFPVKAAILRLHVGETLISTVYLRDLSRLREAEEMARKSKEELAHMGRLGLMAEISTSLAHELTQPLAAILTNSQVLMRHFHAGSGTAEEQESIVADLVNDAHRAGEVIHRVRNMSQVKEFRYEVVTINETILDTKHFLHSQMVMNQTRLTLELAPDLPTVRGDRVQIQQVLLNLMTNAFDAMEETPIADRQLIIRSRYIEPAIVEVCVLDNGIGMKGLSFKEIVQPFYTTKKHGIGMGLAISNTILQNHGGKLWAEPSQDQGTAICFTLPVVNAASETRNASQGVPNKNTVTLATIFVVDDDPSICTALERLFLSAGYAAETFSSVQEYLQREQYAGGGCVVADLHMPGGSGFELQARLNERSYAMPVIFITGAGDTATGVHAIKEGAADFLVKPIDNDELLQVVARAIESDRQARDRHGKYMIARKKIDKLTAREKEVMHLVVSGLRNKQIAGRLEISEKTVKAHRGQVMQKVELQSVTDLVLLTELVASIT